MQESRWFKLLIAFFLSIFLTVINHSSAAPLCSSLFLSQAEINSHQKINNFFREDLVYQKKKLPAELIDGAIIEGSSKYGGIQPDYRISLHSQEMQTYLHQAKQLGTQNLPLGDLINKVNMLTQETLPKRSYYGLSYRLYLKESREQNSPVSLDGYINRGCGVCRESAILNHFALKSAGLSPKLVYVKISRTFFGKEILEDHAINLINFNGEDIVVDAYFVPFNGQKYSALIENEGINYSTGINGAYINSSGSEVAKIIGILPYPKLYLPVGKKEFKSFNVYPQHGQKITFIAEGRSEAERKFKQEEAQIEQAEANDIVTIEWIFHPFYRPLGHTSLRVGNKSYEFTTQGWELHNNKTDSARAFIFNNPFFKHQYRENNKDNSMPPFSIGIPIKIKKSQVDQILSWINRYPQDFGKAFSITFNNCNQCMLSAMKEAGVKVNLDNIYSEFSSVMTFRSILLSPQENTGTPVIYPLSGVNTPFITYREMMPPYLYEESSTAKEIMRVLTSSIKKRMSE